MAINRKTINEIYLRVKTDIESGLGLSGKSLRFSLVGVLAKSIAGISHMLFGYLSYISREAFVTTALDFLEYHGATWGVARNAASYATGTIKILGTSGLDISAGTVFTSSAGVDYELDSLVTISSGEAFAEVTALTPGADGNLAQNEVLTIASTVAGVEPEAEVQVGGVSGGADIEDLEDYRVRILNRIQQPPHGGNANDFIQWAKAVDGVTRAWVYPNNRGTGTVDVTFVQDGQEDIIPNSAAISDVQDYIDELRPVTSDCIVFAPTPKTLDLTIKISPNTLEVQTTIEQSLKDLFFEKAEPGGALNTDGTIYLVHLIEAIGVSAGEENHEIVTPTVDFTVSQGEIAELGTITWQAL